MLYICLFLLPSLCTLILLSPVVFRYQKTESATLSVHFVFFSVSFHKKKEQREDGDKEKSKQRKGGKQGNIVKSLRRTLSRSSLYIQSLPLPMASDPAMAAIGAGGYYLLLSLILPHFKNYASAPLLRKGADADATVDIQIRMHLYAILYTFLVYMTKYRKEKEKMSDGRNKNERHHKNLA